MTKMMTPIKPTRTKKKKNSNTTTKLALVLDMDECLIHSEFPSDEEFRGVTNYRPKETRSPEENNDDDDGVAFFEDCFEIFMSDGEKAVVNKRPGLDAFLKLASAQYDVYIFTAGLRMYIQPVIDILDPDGVLFTGCYFRDSCVLKNGLYLKDLEIIQRPLSRVVLVDNNPISFLPQPSNGIPVPSFYDDPYDTTLVALQKVLSHIAKKEDVRPSLTAMFRLPDLLEEHQKVVLSTVM